MKTFYCPHGFATPSLSFGASKVVPMNGQGVAFSNLKGGFGGMSASFRYSSGSFGSTPSYRFFSLGLTAGKPLSFLKELKGAGTFNLGVTTLLGKPRYAVAIFQEHISNVKR